MKAGIWMFGVGCDTSWEISAVQQGLDIEQGLMESMCWTTRRECWSAIVAS